MPIYDAEVNPTAENNSHALMLTLVGPDRNVLDVGCATGYLGEALIAQGCRVRGVELDPDAAERARKVLDEVLVADLETADLVAHFGAGSFDTVVFGDVLEHLRDPGRLLRNAVDLLTEKGSIVISLPNVTHGAVRLALLQGRWEYRDTGLLDRTHVTFFSRANLTAMLQSAGLVPVDLRVTTADLFATEIGVDRGALPDGVVEWVEAQPDADVYQFVLRAVRDDADGAVERLRVRHDEVTAALREAEAALAEKNAQIEVLKHAGAGSDDRADDAERELAALSNTRTVRALRGPRRLYGATRRALRG